MALPEIYKAKVKSREYTYTATGGEFHEFMGDGNRMLGRRLLFLEPCWAALGANTDHILLEIYRRRPQDFFKKSFWWVCPKCDGCWLV